MLEGEPGGRRARVHADLAVDVAQVRTDRNGGDYEFPGHLGAGEALSNQAQNLYLALRQAGGIGFTGRRGRARKKK